MLKENIKDIEHVTISKGITFEVGKDKVLNVNIGLFLCVFFEIIF
jgi:hypothetical protein